MPKPLQNRELPAVDCRTVCGLYAPVLERERSASGTWLRENDPEHIEAKAHGLTDYEIENGEISTSPLSPMTVVTDTTKAEKLGK